MKLRHLAPTLVLASAGATTLGAASAAAQASVQLDQYRPAQTAEDGFAMSRPDDRGHVRFGAQLQLDYGLNPLVYEATQGSSGSERYSIVEHQLVGHLGLSLGLFDRLVLFAGLPVNLVQSGQSAPAGTTPPAGIGAADGAGLGDVPLGLRVRLFGERGDVFALALQATAYLPTAIWANSGQHYTGERGLTIAPQLLGELRFGGGDTRITANVGARFRATDQARFAIDAGNFAVGHEFTYGLGLTQQLWENANNNMGLDLHVEAYGATTFEHFGDRNLSPLEAILGLKFRPAAGWFVGLAGGPGIFRGYGSPDLRGVFTLGFADPVESAPAPVEPEAAPIGDRDHDGILDDVDQCPNEPEDVDTFEDANGCPDPDNDQDGVLDVNDGAPMDPEDADGFEDTDGVPDPDNDQDLVLDVNDGAPLDPEDRDGFQDSDGVPDPDNDQDTVLDGADQCPLAPGRPEDNGCPRAVRLDTETGQIYILQRVEFATNRDVILERSFPVLEEVRAVLAANPQLTRIRVEGHTDDRGRDAANLDLSVRRARSVRRWLIKHDLPAERLAAFGCGELHPMESNRTNDGRQANRRVEFHILEPAPAQGARSLEGCQEAGE